MQLEPLALMEPTARMVHAERFWNCTDGRLLRPQPSHQERQPIHGQLVRLQALLL